MRRIILGSIHALLICLLLPLGAAAQAPQAARQPVRFVEFYTSEACASCLAADAAFAHLAVEKHVIALGFHVGYWDYLGWKDRFALPAADQRQWDYARCWHSGEVFTPEMIINGAIKGIGNNQEKIAAMLRQATPVPRLGLAIGNGDVVVTIPALPYPAGATLWLAAFDRSRSIAIGHGENAGHVITEVNIVRFAAPVTLLMTPPRTIPVPVTVLAMPTGAHSYDGIAAFVQEAGCGPVAAAGQLLLSHASR